MLTQSPGRGLPCDAQAGHGAQWGWIRSAGAPFRGAGDSVSKKLGKWNGIKGTEHSRSLYSVHIHFRSATRHEDGQDMFCFSPLDLNSPQCHAWFLSAGKVASVTGEANVNVYFMATGLTLKRKQCKACLIVNTVVIFLGVCLILTV